MKDEIRKLIKSAKEKNSLKLRESLNKILRIKVGKALDKKEIEVKKKVFKNS